MIIYEVNLTINKDIFSDYYQWLIAHMEDMLNIPGFQSAEIAKEKNNKEDTQKLTVRYKIKSEEDLNHYLMHRAEIMRNAALEKFGDKFNAYRRIFIEQEVVN